MVLLGWAGLVLLGWPHLVLLDWTHMVLPCWAGLVPVSVSELSTTIWLLRCSLFLFFFFFFLHLHNLVDTTQKWRRLRLLSHRKKCHNLPLCSILCGYCFQSNKLCGSQFANWFCACCPLLCRAGSTNASIPKGVTSHVQADQRWKGDGMGAVVPWKHMKPSGATLWKQPSSPIIHRSYVQIRESRDRDEKCHETSQPVSFSHTFQMPWNEDGAKPDVVRFIKRPVGRRWIRQW